MRVVQLGVDPWEALSMAPLQTAEYCFLNKQFGSVKKIISTSISPYSNIKNHQIDDYTNWYVLFLHNR